MLKTKICSKCKRSKMLSEFYRRPDRLSGTRSSCISCSKKSVDLWRKRNLIRVAKYKRDYNTKPENIWRGLRDNSRHRELSFSLTQQEFVAWYKQQEQVCYYCRRALDFFGSLPPPFNTRFHVDRVDSSKGYELGNLVLACSICNKLKGSYLSREEMRELARRLFGTD